MDWKDLEERAVKIVQETIAKLPDDVRAEAEKLPCLFRKWAHEHDCGDDLGCLMGFQEGVVSEGGVCFLFLGNIHDYCREESLDFEDEVRNTYLHELGHHLGWDEGDLKKRGL